MENLSITQKYRVGFITSVILLLIVAFLFFDSCSTNSKVVANNNALQSEVTQYKLSNGNLASSIKTLQLTKQELNEQILEKDADLKELASKFSKVTALLKLKTTTTIPKIEVPFDIPITKEEVDPETGELAFRREDSIFADWYEFGYVVTQDGLTVEPFNTWTDLNSVSGIKRKWFLGKETLHTDISFTNPYINTEEVTTIIVPIERKWYESRVFNMAVGGLIVYGITR